MSILYLDLFTSGKLIRTLSLTAQSAIETTLTVTPNRAILPTLVSTENIIGSINCNGFELANSDEVWKIAELVNHFLTTPISVWQNQNLSLAVKPLSLSEAQYNEVQNVRSSVINAAREAVYYESQNDPIRSKQAQDSALATIARSVKKEPSWWDQHKGEIYRFIVTTTIAVLIDNLIGIPLGRFVGTIVDGMIG